MYSHNIFGVHLENKCNRPLAAPVYQVLLAGARATEVGVRVTEVGVRVTEVAARAAEVAARATEVAARAAEEVDLCTEAVVVATAESTCNHWLICRS